MIGRAKPAQLPPGALDGWDPSWSRLVSAIDSSGHERTWHVLDKTVPDPVGTLVCVHGNPTWSYAWRRLAATSRRWRVVGVDLLNMGYSERTGSPRGLDDHVRDLGAVVEALDPPVPVVTVAHDWGGPVSLGWAQANREKVAGIVLMNTGVARPEGVKVPAMIRAVRSRATLEASCVRTPTFLYGTLALARPALARSVRQAFAAPYATSVDRRGIADFVADIPIEDDHASFDALARIATGLHEFASTRSLLLWGAKDPVFSDAFLADLVQRLPHADVHRYASAGHLVMEDTDAADVILGWCDRLVSLPGEDAERRGTTAGRRLWAQLEDRRADDQPAVIEMRADPANPVAASAGFAELWRRVSGMAHALAGIGVQRGDRVAPLLAPGIDLTVVVYACWRIGAVVVAADAALGLGGIRRSLRAARPDFVVGDGRGLAAARLLRLPARRLAVGLGPARRALLDAEAIVSSDADDATGCADLPEPEPDDPALVVFTSGSTGPSKAVRYRHRQLEAQRDAIAATYTLDTTDRLVAAFAPFAILGPALGITTVVPAMDVTSPGSLTAQSFADAAVAVGATIAFASPAALGNVVATAGELDVTGRAALASLRAVASAGAPIPLRALQGWRDHFPDARVHTPYGMTEVMPVTDVTLAEIEAAGAGNGVCVGHPIDGVELVVCDIDGDWTVFEEAGRTGEICVRAAHASEGYDRLWAAQFVAWRDRWHRTGDVGHLDTDGRLWVEGRVAHVVRVEDGPVTPVAIEHRVEAVPGVTRAAAVGVGPAGTQKLVVVVSIASGKSDVVADSSLASQVRAAVAADPQCAADVAAVLVMKELPTDRRHNSKIDRSAVAAWATRQLHGSRR